MLSNVADEQHQFHFSNTWTLSVSFQNVKWIYSLLVKYVLNKLSTVKATTLVFFLRGTLALKFPLRGLNFVNVDFTSDSSYYRPLFYCALSVCAVQSPNRSFRENYWQFHALCKVSHLILSFILKLRINNSWRKYKRNQCSMNVWK